MQIPEWLSCNAEGMHLWFFFNVLLTVHLSIILVIKQPDAQNLVFYNKFIKCLYIVLETRRGI